MFADMLRYLLDQKMTTRKEVQQITHRGASTVHRWINGNSQPQYQDMRELVRCLSNPKARRSMVGMLAGDLPIVVIWLEDEKQEAMAQTRGGAGDQTLDASLLTLECLTSLLVEEREAMRKQTLTVDACARITELSDDAIRYITISKNTDVALMTRRKKAREPKTL